MPAVECFAPAKINLYIHVLGRRPDGYHRLESLVVFAGVGDSLRVRGAEDGLSLVVDGPFAAALPEPGDNLATRAARRLAEAVGVAPMARMHLTKRLPAAAGIGGGSADAAAALRALAALWRCDPDGSVAAAVAPSLGADVPVCLRGRPSQMAGIGEDLTPPPPLPPAWLVLVNPGRPLSTAAVFAARRGPFGMPAPLDRPPPTAAALARELAERRNDLAESAIALEPAVGDVLAALEAQEGCLLARMSGSGATCFGLFAAAAVAEAAASAIARREPKWWSVAAPLLGDVETAPGMA